MFELLLLSAAQLAFGLIVVCTLLLIYSIVWEHVHRFFWRRRFYAISPSIQINSDVLTVNEARVASAGSWQYHDNFFNKVTEFRSDFS